MDEIMRDVMTGRQFSEETKKKMSESAKLRCARTKAEKEGRIHG